MDGFEEFAEFDDAILEAMFEDAAGELFVKYCKSRNYIPNRPVQSVCTKSRLGC